MNTFRTIGFVLVAFILGRLAISSAQDTSLDIPRIAYVEDMVLYVFDPTSSEVQAITEYPSYAMSKFLVWTNDGEWLAYLSPTTESNQFTLSLNNLQGEIITLVTDAIAPTYQPQLLDDGRILYASYIYPFEDEIIRHNVYAIAPEMGAEAELLGEFVSRSRCGGGASNPAEADYYIDADLHGYRKTFALSPYGLVHDGTSVYQDCFASEIAITDLETGDSQFLAGDGFVKGVLSPDGESVMGILDGQLSIVRLDDMTVISLSTNTLADQYIWGDNDTIYYSSYEVTGDLLISLNETELENVRSNLNRLPASVPSHRISLHRLDLQTGEDSLLYTEDAFAIGRIELGDNWLIFSQIDNPNEWVNGLANNTINITTTIDSSRVQLFALNIETLEIHLILENAPQMLLAP